MKTLDGLLDQVVVYSPVEWENNIGPKDWYAVATDDDGIIAYFYKEVDAYRFRLDYINRELNP